MRVAKKQKPLWLLIDFLVKIPCKLHLIIFPIPYK